MLSYLCRAPASTFRTPPLHLPLPSQLPGGSQTLKLPDGRLLGYSEIGPGNGRPIFYIPGCPDNRVGILSSGDIAAKLNARLIGIDRPGYGLSTFYPHRKIIDFVQDFQHLRDHLNVKEYRAIGVSGGTAYLLALAKNLPRNELKGAGIMIGCAPPEAGMNGTSWANWLGIKVAKHAPGLLKWFLDRYVVPSAQDPDPKKMADFWRRILRSSHGKDKEALEKDFDIVVDIWRENYRQSSDGQMEDMRLMLSDWDMRLEDVDFETIKLYYGEKDTHCPVAMGRWMEKRLPHASMKVFEGETHFSMWDRCEEVLEDLLKGGTC